MKQTKYILIVSLSLTVLVSCKKYLDVPDNSTVNRQSYVKDLNSMQEFMNGIYVILSPQYEGYRSGAYAEIVADNIKSVTTSSLSMPLQYNWSQVVDASSNNTNFSMSTAWMDMYKVIRNCNFAIEDVGKYSNEDPSKANSIKGQALALRALIHFRLVNMFAQAYAFTPDASHLGVPYITTSDITKTYSRQTVAEVYNNMIADLDKAILLLPAIATDCRFVNAPAAKALLARIYLFKEDYEKARILAAALATQHPLMTIGGGYPVSIFRNISPAQTEVLFQLTPVSMEGSNGSFMGAIFALNRMRATNDIALILREYPTDARKDWVTEISPGQWTGSKFPAGIAGIHPSASTDYYAPVLRSSEMFLIASECYAKAGDENNARNYLNAVRKRANPAIADITASGQALMDSLYKERRKELCFEGLRMYDLQRWKKGVQRTDVFAGYQTTLPYPSNKAISPIPYRDVNLMRLQQNPGY